MEPTESSETSTYNNTLTPGTYPKEKKLQNIIYFYKASTFEPGYNDMGLYNTSPVESDILLAIKSLL